MRIIPGVFLILAAAVSTASAQSSFSMDHGHAADAASAAASASAAVTPAAAAPEASVVNPLSRSIEVTGFRLVMDPSKKPEIHYLVVNHTPVRVSNMTVYVTLRTADDKPGQPPLSRFSFAAPNLGPFQSKEMMSSIEKMNRPVELPEWQDLRADLEIGQ